MTAKTTGTGYTIAIIGGGFSGAAVAVHLLADERLALKPSIIVVEPRSNLGRGVAYGSIDPAHRVNVPAGRMTLFPDLPDDFEDYARQNSDPQDDQPIGRDGLAYPRRSVFGDYMGARLKPLLASGAFAHWRTFAESIERIDGRYRVEGTDGGSILADLLVLATSHPSPALPSVLLPFKDDAKIIPDANAPGALEAIGTADRVLIIGNGLTAADVLASIHRRGHSGHVTSISRRGLRSRGHGPAGQEPFGDFLTTPHTSASALLHRVRELLREGEKLGLTWHSVVDALRIQGQGIWAALPLAERKRIVRHIRPFWDVHRFRIAPQVEDAIDVAIAEGRMDILAASISAVVRSGNAYRVTLKKRHSHILTDVEVDAIVVTTGPAHQGILKSQEYLARLHANGLLQACPTGLGILVDERAHPVSHSGEVLDTIFVAGPLARGTFGELMGLPQVTEHAIFIARQIADLLQSVAGQDTGALLEEHGA